MKITFLAACALVALLCVGCASSGSMRQSNATRDAQPGTSGAFAVDGAPPGGIVDYTEILANPGLP